MEPLIHKLTNLPSYRPTVLPSYRPTVLQSYSPMISQPNNPSCGSPSHFTRRTLLQLAGASGIAWLTPVAHLLARAEERDKGRTPAKSVILLWLAGGPSQLESFDPHPGHDIAGGTTAIDTAAPGVRLAAGLERLTEQMDSVSIVRSVVSKEDGHDRVFCNIQSEFRPVPAIVHPFVGAVVCHQLPQGNTEIPRHVSVFPIRGRAAKGTWVISTTRSKHIPQTARFRTSLPG